MEAVVTVGLNRPCGLVRSARHAIHGVGQHGCVCHVVCHRFLAVRGNEPILGFSCDCIGLHLFATSNQ